MCYEADIRYSCEPDLPEDKREAFGHRFKEPPRPQGHPGADPKLLQPNSNAIRKTTKPRSRIVMVCDEKYEYQNLRCPKPTTVHRDLLFLYPLWCDHCVNGLKAKCEETLNLFENKVLYEPESGDKGKAPSDRAYRKELKGIHRAWLDAMAYCWEKKKESFMVHLETKLEAEHTKLRSHWDTQMWWLSVKATVTKPKDPNQLTLSYAFIYDKLYMDAVTMVVQASNVVVGLQTRPMLEAGEANSTGGKWDDYWRETEATTKKLEKDVRDKSDEVHMESLEKLNTDLIKRFRGIVGPKSEADLDQRLKAGPSGSSSGGGSTGNTGSGGDTYNTGGRGNAGNQGGNGGGHRGGNNNPPPGGRGPRGHGGRGHRGV